MSKQASKPYKCTLTKDILEKAKQELNEDPSTRNIEVQTIRERILKYPGLTARVDYGFLLQFLRARKFDQERTFDLIVNHYKMKKENEDTYTDMTPKGVKHMLDAGVVTVLPERGRDGEAIVIFKPGRWDATKYPIIDLYKTIFVAFSYVLEQHEDIQVCGIRLVNDLGELTWTHAKCFTPTFAKRIGSLMQDVIPMRLKGIHYVHEPSFFDMIFTLIKQFMREKMAKRLNLHGDRLEELQQYFDPKTLPKEYGGKQKDLNTKDFCKQLLKKEADFEADTKYGFVSMTMKEQKGADAMETLPGTFKKLNVD